MSEIKYWRIETTSAGSPFHNAHPDGDVVRRVDYESLERQLAATQALLESQAQTANDEFIKLWNERDTLRQSLQRAEGERDAVNAALDLYRSAMDKIYNHNEAARVAVVQHFGTLHIKPLPASDGGGE